MLFYHKGECPIKEVRGSSPCSGKTLYIFTLSPFGTESQKCIKTERPTKIGVSSDESAPALPAATAAVRVPLGLIAFLHAAPAPADKG